jgi:hypothetical protein
VFVALHAGTVCTYFTVCAGIATFTAILKVSAQVSAVSITFCPVVTAITGARITGVAVLHIAAIVTFATVVIVIIGINTEWATILPYTDNLWMLASCEFTTYTVKAEPTSATGVIALPAVIPIRCKINAFRGITAFNQSINAMAYPFNALLIPSAFVKASTTVSLVCLGIYTFCSANNHPRKQVCTTISYHATAIDTLLTTSAGFAASTTIGIVKAQIHTDTVAVGISILAAKAFHAGLV